MPGPYKWQYRMRGFVPRWTQPRDLILDLLSQTSKHMSAKEIYDSIRKTHPGIGLTTIYRTLDLLYRMGFINKFDFGEGQSRYEFKSGGKKEHHHHLICIRCGKIIDYSDFVEEELELIKKVEQALEKKQNFRIHDHNIEFYGVCDKCK